MRSNPIPVSTHGRRQWLPGAVLALFELHKDQVPAFHPAITATFGPPECNRTGHKSRSAMVPIEHRTISDRDRCSRPATSYR